MIDYNPLRRTYSLPSTMTICFGNSITVEV
jgi:hypothetical protein